MPTTFSFSDVDTPVLCEISELRKLWKSVDVLVDVLVLLGSYLGLLKEKFFFNLTFDESKSGSQRERCTDSEIISSFSLQGSCHSYSPAVTLGMLEGMGMFEGFQVSEDSGVLPRFVEQAARALY